MWAFLLKLIDPISGIADAISKAKIASANAATSQAKVAADERVKTLELRRDVMVAESSGRLNAWMRAAIAFGPAVYLNKIFVYDKVLALGSTDDLSDNLWKVVVAVVAFYFLYDITARLKR